MQQQRYALIFKFMLGLLLALPVCMAAQTTPTPDDQPKTGHTVPPVWSAFYNVEQGPLPDTSNWKIVLHGKQVVMRLAPGTDWSQFRQVAAGEVRYTGSENRLKPRKIAQLTDLLQFRLEEDLLRVKLAPVPGATQKLVVDANITDARTAAGAYVGRANVTAWVCDAATKQPVASIELVESGKRYEQGFDLFSSGEIRLVLRDESRTIAQALNELTRISLAAAKTSSH